MWGRLRRKGQVGRGLGRSRGHGEGLREGRKSGAWARPGEEGPSGLRAPAVGTVAAGQLDSPGMMDSLVPLMDCHALLPSVRVSSRIWQKYVVSSSFRRFLILREPFLDPLVQVSSIRFL